MRKISRRRKKIGMKGLISLFLCCLAFIGIGYSFLSENLVVSGKTTLVKQEFEEEKLRFTYTKEIWGGNPYTVQFDITIENISDEIFESWILNIPITEEFEIINSWNTIAELRNGTLILKNEYYNGNIGIDGKLTLGLQVTTNNKDIELSKPNVNLKDEEEQFEQTIEGSGLEIILTPTQTWSQVGGTYTSYTVTVKNNGKEEINGWSFKMVIPEQAKYSSSWEANYIVQDTGIVFSNVSYNGSIAPGGSVSFGTVIQYQGNSIEPTVIEIVKN